MLEQRLTCLRQLTLTSLSVGAMLSIGCSSASCEFKRFDADANDGAPAVATPESPSDAMPGAVTPRVRTSLAAVHHVKIYPEESLGRHNVDASVDLRLMRASDKDRLYVHGKLSCRQGSELLVNYDQTGADMLDRAGLSFFDEDTVPSECTLQLRLSGRDGAVWEDLGAYCWRDGDTHTGACAPDHLDSTELDTREPQLKLASSSIEYDDGIVLNYRFRMEQGSTHEVEVRTRAACLVGDVGIVEIDETDIDAGAFDFAPGDLVPLRVELFDDEDRFDLEAIRAATCEIEIEATPAELETHLVQRLCIVGGVLSDGACAGQLFARVENDKPDQPLQVLRHEAKTMTSRFSENPAERGIRFDLDILAHRPLAGEPRVSAEVACKVGSSVIQSDRASSSGTDVEDLRAGEVSRLQVEAFTMEPLPREPQWCQLDLTDWRNDSRPAYATVCWRSSGTSLGPCK